MDNIESLELVASKKGFSVEQSSAAQFSCTNSSVRLVQDDSAVLGEHGSVRLPNGVYSESRKSMGTLYEEGAETELVSK